VVGDTRVAGQDGVVRGGFAHVNGLADVAHRHRVAPRRETPKVNTTKRTGVSMSASHTDSCPKSTCACSPGPVSNRIVARAAH
jgi:hypothetical protein